MASQVNFSLKRFSLLLIVVPIGAGVIFVSDQYNTGINWKVIANTTFIAGLLMAGIVKFIIYRKSKKANPAA